MAKIIRKVPATPQLAKKKGYAKAVVKHTALEKRRWTMVKQSGKWNFVKVASASAAGPHTVCYYDPKTGFYDDCHTVG
jgi:hypothetical protein